jgi:hypothetical protein
MDNPITISVNNVPIELNNDIWIHHILLNHQEMKTYKGAVLDTITYPDEVREQGEGVFISIRRYGSRFLNVVYKEESEKNGFVITAFFIQELTDKFLKMKKTFPKKRG